MSGPSGFVAAERSALTRLLSEVGPDAPTLCAGWTTRDLAAHLVARDRRPHSLPGLVLRPMAGLTERSRRRLRDRRSYESLVALVGAGPPPWSPVGLPPVAQAANPVELLVHHEDVRRAQPGWEPRTLDRDGEELVWRRVRAMAPRLVRRVGTAMRLHRPGGPEMAVGDGGPAVTVTGAPVELLLLVLGRQAAARVRLEGDDAAVARLRGADLGI